MVAKVRSQVRKLPGYHLDQPQHRIKLNQNESPYDLPSALKKRILARLDKVPWNRYPTPYADTLRAKLGRKLKWNPAGILVANGSNVLTQALVATMAVGGKVAAPDPSFSLYELYGRLFNNRMIKVRLRPDFSLDAERFERALKKERPDLTFIPNPNAPTGNLFEMESLKKLVTAAPGFIVIDEAYYPFSGETLLPFLKRNPKLVLLRTFSKAFSLGGVRVGYLVGHPTVVREIRKVLPPFCLNALSALVTESVLDSPQYTDKIVREITKEREKIFGILEKLEGITPFPSDANFILFRARKAKAIYKGLLKAGILIRDVSDGAPLKNCLRVTVGTPKENQAFVKAIKKLV
jgi:histidinol-phosphate aminotransferase